MTRKCPNQNCAAPKIVIRDGVFQRKDDSKSIQRFRCKSCSCRFSSATFSDTYWQKKRRVNRPLLNFLASGMSLRRSALLLNINHKTAARRLPFLAQRCRRQNKRFISKLRGRVFNVQMDDLITKENSKLKPLSVSIVVDQDRRSILALEVSQIPAFGHLADLAVKKYGKRKNMHPEGLKRVFESIKQTLSPEVVFKTDEHQRYPEFIKEYFPRAKHLTFKSERACIAGQGELKKVNFDPLFTINHTCAIMRANVNRLIRKTWCTTKDPARLKDHLEIFIFFYNEKLLTPI